ncbi:MAG: hypothetical protein R2778_17975 [Saprospiraceae bacterium]
MRPTLHSKNSFIAPPVLSVKFSTGIYSGILALAMILAPLSNILIAQTQETAPQASSPLFIGAEMFASLNDIHQAHIVLKKYVPCDQADIHASETVIIHEVESKLFFARLDLQRMDDTTTYEKSTLDCGHEMTRANTCIKPVYYAADLDLLGMPGGYEVVWMQAKLDQTMDHSMDGPAGFSLALHLPDPIGNSVNDMPEMPALKSQVFCSGKTYEIDLTGKDNDGDALSYELSEPMSFKQDKSSESGPAYVPGDESPKSIRGLTYQTILRRPPFQTLAEAGDDGAVYTINPSTCSIDPQTGILKFSPDHSGTYLLGINIHETRNGKKISTHQSVFLLEAL